MKKTPSSPLRVSALLLASAVTLPAQTSPAAQPGNDDPIVRLSEFEVSTTRDTPYRANNSVSSNRANTALFDTPQSITVLTEEFLRDIEMIDLNEALAFIPGVVEGQAGVGGDNPVESRGQAMTRLVDNMPDESSNVRPDTALVERVEVLKGTSSSLYGSSSPGGVINTITKKPKAKPAYVLNAQFGAYNLRRQTIDFTGPLNASKSLRYRLVAAYEQGDNFRDYVNNDRWTLLPALTYVFQPGTQATVTHEYLHTRQTMDAGLPIFTGDTAVRLPRERYLSLPEFDYQIIKRATRAFLDHRFSEHWSMRAGYVYTTFWLDKPGGQLTGQASATTRRQARRINTQHIEADSHVFQADLLGQFTTGPLAHRTLLGVDWRRRNNDLSTVAQNITPNFVNVDTPTYNYTRTGAPSTLNHNTSESVSAGAFIQDQASLFQEKLVFLVGVRLDATEQDSTSLTLPQPVNYVAPRVLTPRYAGLWHPVPNLTLYGAYGESFQPDLSGRPIFGTDKRLDPVTGTLYEAGAKSKLFSGRLWLDVNAFQLERENIVTADPDNAGFVQQSGLERSKGYEISFNGDPLPNLTVFGGYAFTDGKVVRDTNRTLIGKPLRGLSRNNYTIFTKYRFRSGRLKGLGFGAGLRRSDERPGATNTTLRFPGYTVANAQANYAWRHYSFNVSVTNLFDEYYWANVAAFNGNRAGEPRAWRASVRASF